MPAHNKTVHEMTSASADEVTVYKLNKAQGDQLMRKLGHMKEGERFLNGDVGRKLQEKGGLIGKLARHCQKWLTDAGSETTIPLTEAEHKDVAKLGVKLAEA